MWRAYQSHARQLDRDFSPAGTQPILQHLQSLGRTRGLVFGAYGEASADVHDLIAVAATARATQLWRAAGARTAAEMRAMLMGQWRRRVGMATVQAMARHRLARRYYIGVPRAVVAGHMQRRREARRAQAQPQVAWVHEARDVFADLARFQARDEAERDME